MQRRAISKPLKAVHKPTQVPKKESPKKEPQKKESPKKESPNKLSKDWQPIAKNVMICSGFYSQGHKRFKGRNEQGAAVCIVACVFARMLKIHEWTKETLMQILEIGTNLYLKTRQMSENRCLGNMEPHQVYKYFFINDLKISIHIDIDVISTRLSKDATLPQKLQSLIAGFFAKHTSGVFTNQQKYLAIWQSNKLYFLFDPADHSRDGSTWAGLPGQGYCCIMRFISIKALVDVILKNFPIKITNKYTIYPCGIDNHTRIKTTPPESVSKIQPPQKLQQPQTQTTLKKSRLVSPSVPVPKEPSPKPDGKGSIAVPEPPSEGPEVYPKPSVSKSRLPPERRKLASVTNFSEVIPGRMGILRASTHQRDPKFTKYLGQQALANSVAALAMLRQYKSKIWVRPVLDEVLKLGEVIHHASKDLPPGKITNKITLNGKNYTPNIERYGVMGRLQSTDDRILNLEQALNNILIDTDCCILIGPNVVPIWREENRYYMFDPDSRDATGKLVQEPPGVACLTWYTKLNDLLTVYTSNVPKNQLRDRFMICKVAIKDFAPLAEDWYNFRALTFNKWILRGNFSQQDRRFSSESRNSQCTANATMALAYKELKQEQEWDSTTVDRVLLSGDEFYRGCCEYLRENGKFKDKYLMVDELKRSFEVENKKIDLEIHDCLVNGIINAKSDTGIPNLKRGFEEFFTESEAGIVTANLQSMAVWKKGETYYYYDSHSRNEKGIVCGHGTACILRVVNIEDLTNALTVNLGANTQNFYNISRIVVKLIDMTEEGVVTMPLNNYEAINKLVAILRSNFSEKDKKFNINAGRQSVPMCLSALAMNILAPSFEWNKQDIDHVLTFGDKLYTESMEDNYNKLSNDDDNIVDISTDNCKKELKIGSNKFEMALSDLAQGTVGDSLREGLEHLNEKTQQEGFEAFQSILESKLITVSMWYDGNLYYLFDPKPRDEQGQAYGKEEWAAEPGQAEQGEEEKDSLKNDDYDEMGGGDNFGNIPDDEDQSEEQLQGDIQYDVENYEESESRSDQELQEPQPENKDLEVCSAKDQENGRACVLRFSTIEDLINHLLENSPPYEEFSLKAVAIDNTPILHEVFDPEVEEKKDEFVGDWNQFKEIDYGKWILRGSKNLNDALFPEHNRNRQEIPMCIIALVFADIFDLSKFSPEVVDNILAYGDRLFTLVQKTQMKELQNNKDLGLSEKEIAAILLTGNYGISDYPSAISLSEKRTSWDVNLGTVAGDITSKISAVPNIASGLDTFFENNSYGILQCRNYSVSVWKKQDIFYIFDPHSVGPNGRPSPTGVACIARFKNIADLEQIYLKKLPPIGDNFFEIHAFVIKQEQRAKERPVEVKEEKVSKLSGFIPVTKDKYILRSDLKWDYTKFAGSVHIHSPTIAFVALALSLCKDSDTWTRIMVNEILNIGEDLYNESIDKLGNKFNPWMDKLDIYRVNPDFKIGKMNVNTALRFMEQRGIVDIKNSKTPNLRQGLERFFEENSHGILFVNKLILPIWEHEADEKVHIYLYDPNSRGPTGLPTQGGVACALRFLNAKTAADHVMACLQGLDKCKEEFAIVPVEVVIGALKTKRKKPCKPPSPIKPTVSVIKKPPPLATTKPVTCPDKQTILEEKRTLRRIAEEEREKKQAKQLVLLGRKEMYQINSKEMIVRGLRSTAKEKDLAVNVIAIVFMQIASDLSKWTYKQVELVLESGYQFYIDSFNAYRPKTAKIGLEHLLRRIIVKGNEVKLDIRKPIPGSLLTKDNVLLRLTNFFTLFPACIFSYEDHVVSVYFKSGYYYLFDPYNRDLNGDRVAKGCAMLMRFSDLPSLVDKIVKNLSGLEDNPKSVFSFILVAIQSVQPLTGV